MENFQAFLVPLYFFISFFRGRFGEKYGFGLIKVCFFFLFFETKAIGCRSMVGLDLAGDHHEFDQNRGRGLHKKLLLGLARPSCIIPKELICQSYHFDSQYATTP